MKWNFLKESKRHRLPSIGASFYTEYPTGDASQQLGSGLTNYALNVMVQKSFSERPGSTGTAGFCLRAIPAPAHWEHTIRAAEWLGKSVYESYFQGDGSGSLVAKNVVRRTGELNLQPSKGPGRGISIYRPGPYKAQIGKWTFSFGNPSQMEMSDTSFWTGVGDHGFEFAPTSACDLSEVDVHNKRLKWFRYDRNASVTLPLADLAK
jgi:hypothetical protein